MQKNRFTAIDIHWFDGFAFGVFVATVAGCIIFGFVSETDTGRWDAYLIALLAGILTLVTAIIAWRAILLQIVQADMAEAARRERSLEAAKALLPIGLDEILDVCHANIRRHYDEDDVPFFDGPITRELTKISIESIQIVRDCIEHAPAAVQRELTDILASYQVLIARDEVLKRKEIIKIGKTEFYTSRMEDAINWATVADRVSNLFSYARKISAIVAPWNATSEGVINMAQYAGLDTPEELAARIREKAEKGTLGFQFWVNRAA